MGADTLTAWALVLTAAGTFITAIVSAFNLTVSRRNSEHMKRIEVATDGMKTELVNEVRAAATAKGIKQGKEEAGAT